VPVPPGIPPDDYWPQELPPPAADPKAASTLANAQPGRATGTMPLLQFHHVSLLSCRKVIFGFAAQENTMTTDAPAPLHDPGQLREPIGLHSLWLDDGDARRDSHGGHR